MNNKKLMQDTELNAVTGGNVTDPLSGRTRCLQCSTWFERSKTATKRAKSGCSSFDLYKCPDCGSWVKIDGRVYYG